MEQRKSNISIYGWRIFKLLLAVFAFWFVYRKIKGQHDIDGYLFQLKVAFGRCETVVYLISVFVLMIFNWLFEAMKWKLMIARLEKVSLFRSLEAVCSGLTISIFTPNRIGEYAGRVFHLGEANKVQATIVTVIENLSQLLVTILFGSIASWFYFFRYEEIPFSINILVCVSLLIVSLSSVMLFLNIRFVENVLLRIKVPEKWRSAFHVLSEYKTSELLRVFMLAILRYVMFFLQFFLLIRMYGGDSGFFSSLIMIAMTYLTISIVPGTVLTELGVRGVAASYFFSKLSPDVLPVINAVVSLWLINLAIPALAGALFMLNFRLGKRKTE